MTRTFTLQLVASNQAGSPPVTRDAALLATFKETKCLIPNRLRHRIVFRPRDGHRWFCTYCGATETSDLDPLPAVYDRQTSRSPQT